MKKKIKNLPDTLSEKLIPLINEINSGTMSSRYKVTKIDLLALLNLHIEDDAKLTEIYDIIQFSVEGLTSEQSVTSFIKDLVEEGASARSEIISLTKDIEKLVFFEDVGEEYNFTDHFSEYRTCFHSMKMFDCCEKRFEKIELIVRLSLCPNLHRLDIDLLNLQNEQLFVIPHLVGYSSTEKTINLIKKCVFSHLVRQIDTETA